MSTLSITIGILMLTAVFAVLFIYIWVEDGIRVALAIFGIVGGLVLFVTVGVYLITGSAT